jgi:hypothetical protein
MHYFVRSICAGISATILVGVATLTPTPARAVAGKVAETGDQCMQGGGQGEKDQVAREPEIRQKLHHNVPQRASHHECQRIAQKGESKDFAGTPTPGMGM